ncbi:MAG: winged helix-turn-helix transcriptional regulator [Thermoplasmatota archaeon]
MGNTLVEQRRPNWARQQEGAHCVVFAPTPLCRRRVSIRSTHHGEALRHAASLCGGPTDPLGACRMHGVRLMIDGVVMHPRRLNLLAFVQGNPGASFREIARRTGIAPGTARHHLTVLVRSGLILERSQGNTQRFFAGDAQHEDSWNTVALLRDSALACLLGWLAANPGAPQRQVIEAMQGNGWSRSTTQHRLKRLAIGGAASVKMQGRLRLYSANPAPSTSSCRQAAPPLHLHALAANNHPGPEPSAWRRNAEASRVPPLASALHMQSRASSALWPEWPKAAPHWRTDNT